MTSPTLPFGIIDTVNDDNIIVTMTPPLNGDSVLPHNVTIVNRHHRTNSRAYALGYITEVADTVASVIITAKHADPQWPHDVPQFTCGLTVYLAPHRAGTPTLQRTTDASKQPFADHLMAEFQDPPQLPNDVAYRITADDATC